MIIECKNCLKKFTVRDSDIPIKGRTVQCGNCSTQWLQMPITTTVKIDDLNVDDVDQEPSKISSTVTTETLDVDEDLSKNEFVASDGKNYKFLGSQWAQVLPSGKTGRLAKKKISTELNRLTGKEACLGLESSPLINSLLISKVTIKKKTAIKASLIQ